MRKFFLFSAIFSLSIFYTSAQSFHFGIKAGADIHKISGETFSNEFNLGYHAGVFAQIGLKKNISLQPEFILSDINSRTATNFREVYGFKDINKIKLQYLNIPILLNVKLAPFLTLQAGPQFGILIDKTKSIVENGKEDFKNGDVGAAGALQINLKKINIYGRYVAGLGNINKIGTEKWNNQTIQLGVGIRLF